MISIDVVSASGHRSRSLSAQRRCISRCPRVRQTRHWANPNQERPASDRTAERPACKARRPVMMLITSRSRGEKIIGRGSPVVPPLVCSTNGKGSSRRKSIPRTLSPRRIAGDAVTKIVHRERRNMGEVIKAADVTLGNSGLIPAPSIERNLPRSFNLLGELNSATRAGRRAKACRSTGSSPAAADTRAKVLRNRASGSTVECFLPNRLSVTSFCFHVRFNRASRTRNSLGPVCRGLRLQCHGAKARPDFLLS